MRHVNGNESARGAAPAAGRTALAAPRSPGARRRAGRASAVPASGRLAGLAGDGHSAAGGQGADVALAALAPGWPLRLARCAGRRPGDMARPGGTRRAPRLPLANGGEDR